MPFYYFPMNSYYMFGYLLVYYWIINYDIWSNKVNSAYKR